MSLSGVESRYFFLMANRMCIGLFLIITAGVVLYYRKSPVVKLQWAEDSPVTVFWREDGECSHHQTRFLARHSLPARALVSYPGSGNTWTRYLLEAATGVFTGSVYNDDEIYKAGHLGEKRDHTDGSTLVQKTHHSALGPHRKNFTWRIEHIEQFGGRGVLVIRNPYRAIISFWNHKKAGHTNTAVLESLESEEFKTFVIDQAERWLEVTQDWLELSHSCPVIFYEVSEVTRSRYFGEIVSVSGD